MKPMYCQGCKRPLQGGRAYRAVQEERAPMCFRCEHLADKRLAAQLRKLFRADFVPRVRCE